MWTDGGIISGLPLCPYSQEIIGVNTEKGVRVMEEAEMENMRGKER